MPIALRTEADLQGLLGVSESYTLEFKQSQVLTQGNEKIAETLSRVISAFANSEGGQIIVGIRESSGRHPRVAESIDDGIDPTQMPPERLQQIIAGNIRPPLASVRVIPIVLSRPQGRRFAFVIEVPQGSTAYQASDHRYYGRFEYECRPLPDNEIRTRMERGRTARAELRVNGVTLQWMGEHGVSYGLHCCVANTGQLTIRDYRLVVSPGEIFNGKSDMVHATRLRTAPSNDEPEEVLFPGESKPVEFYFRLTPSEGQLFTAMDRIIEWTIYLDDASPAHGELLAGNLASMVRNPLQGRAWNIFG